MNVTARQVTVESFGINFVDVFIEGAEDTDFLEDIDAQVAVDHYGTSTLLDLIGKDAAMAFFDIVEAS